WREPAMVAVRAPHRILSIHQIAADPLAVPAFGRHDEHGPLTVVLDGGVSDASAIRRESWTETRRESGFRPARGGNYVDASSVAHGWKDDPFSVAGDVRIGAARRVSRQPDRFTAGERLNINVVGSLEIRVVGNQPAVGGGAGHMVVGIGNGELDQAG